MHLTFRTLLSFTTQSITVTDLEDPQGQKQRWWRQASHRRAISPKDERQQKELCIFHTAERSHQGEGGGAK